MEERMKRHLKDAKRIKDNNHFHNALLKYGLDNFESEVIDVAYSKEELNEKEIYWIAYYGTFNCDGYNECEGGNGGGKRSKETCEKLAKR